MPRWITWVIPSIQFVLLGVQLYAHRKSMKLSKKQKGKQNDETTV